ncbi:acylneuraminate cytidylyltransferase family protein [Candidatus Methylopumilus universalis]|jgi:CMP-N,N'-diacetyllegionaminic acid synthase|uniref:acylneuraminate cytidylyltransferase family protein n=1 Tax=Candidatus Methylopumilus universalis TaxID=2588536 RepID=UPI001122E99E|nr:acylneuraminate cytidylyltransferase family protein [Candidatus Methylopumilus universalis]QDC70745.1 acylneuraminate cytidylyltransferase family protein [Candidatus Methylopumilus universalis]
MSLKKNTFIALIPARAGSKGVINKNFKKVGGKPLIFFTISEAKKVRSIDQIYVSSDSIEIINYSVKMLVSSLLRPKKYSKDDSTAADVVKHFLGRLPERLRAIDPYLIYLQPTSPLRKATHINQSITLVNKLNLNSLVSVKKIDSSLYKSLNIKKNNKIATNFNENFSISNRQSLPDAYTPNGAIYIFKMSSFLKKGSIPINGSYAFIMNNEESLDIDSNEDFARFGEAFQS